MKIHIWGFAKNCDNTPRPNSLADPPNQFNEFINVIKPEVSENSRSQEFSTRVSFNFSRSTTRYDFVKSRPRFGITKLKLQAFSLEMLASPEIAYKIVKTFNPEFRERWQLLELSFSSRKPRSDQGNSRSHLEA